VTAASGVTVSLALAGSQNTGGRRQRHLIGVENLTGTSFNDVLSGDAGNNTLMAGRAPIPRAMRPRHPA
jgi:hypothetical protein